MRLFITTAVAALAMAGAASAQTAGPAPAPKPAAPAAGQYISVSGGLVGKTDYDVGFAGGYKAKADVDAGAQGAVAWGSTIGNGWRAEIALGYRSQDSETVVTWNGTKIGATDGKVEALSIDINGYYDFPVSGPAKPYLGAGIGVAQVKFSDDLIDDKGDALTLQGIAGVSFAVSPTISLFAEGRYQYTGSIKIKTTSPSGEQNSHLSMTGPAALVGARFAF
ncbi:MULTISPECIES: porin family protein [unclassified Caulobacter]|uniref:outer membrane protein n=1 Tax=unclassified Caulobacter TaxID=2648921 RepID=UPI0004A761E3|nr:porin family protein [Caulobacter sp. UNC358MFTsu5.1]